MLTWHGGPYDPAEVGEAGIVAVIGKLARRRTLGRAAYLKSVGRYHRGRLPEQSCDEIRRQVLQADNECGLI